jgi:hypothetical protein
MAMKSAMVAMAVGVLAVLAGGCGDAQEKNLQREIRLYKELNVVLDRVTDEASLDAVLPKLEELNAQIKENVAEQKTMKPATEERRRALLAEYAEKLDKQRKLFGENMSRITKIKGLDAQKMLKAIRDVPAES